MLLWLLVAGVAHAQSVTTATYKVGLGDVLKVSVWSEPTLSGPFTVGASGALDFPLIGPVPAAGRGTDEIARDIRARLADGYLREPQVAVEVAEFNSQRVFVVGEVRTPGPVALTGSLTLIEALARVGSLTETAGGELLVIRPPAGRTASGPILQSEAGAQEMLRMDVKALQAKGPTSNVLLQDGDTIVVPRAEFVYVTGQVKSPGSFAFDPQLTALQLINLAGGVTEMGSTKRIKIVRIEGGKKIEIKAALGDRLRPGDTLEVSTRWF